MFRNARSGFSRHVLQSDGTVGSPQRPAVRRDKNLQSWPLVLGRLLLDLLDTLNLWRVVREERPHDGVLIFDRYIFDQLAALPMNNRLLRTYARLLLRIAPKPEVAYLLDAIPEAARERKPEYPLEFLHKYRSSYLDLRSMAPMVLVPAADPEEVHAVVLDTLGRSVETAFPAADVRSAVVA